MPPLLFVCLATLAVFGPRLLAPPTSPPAPLTREAYVWQRVQHSGVQAAIREHGAAFRQLTVLAAELTWPSRDPAGPPEIARIALKLPPPAACPPLGLAIRVHAYRGSFAPDAPATRQLIALARELVARTEAGGHRIVELQLDFDAAETQLDAYRQWLDALRAALAPMPVAFTALPAWLDHPAAFARLAHAADSFVLQVHSLTLPSAPGALQPLCDPAEAARAVRRAARAGVPFRVALPTYGYEVAFDARRRFLGIAAEGSSRNWPASAVVQTLRTDPGPLAGLVSTLQQQRPAALTGLIWYRLPVAGDRLNWSWPMLAAVMQGRVPAARLEVDVESLPLDSALLRITLRNTGDADAEPATWADRAPRDFFSRSAFDSGAQPASTTTPPPALALCLIELSWTGSRPVASDAIAGFTLQTETANSVRFLAPAGFRLPAHSAQPVGWVRLDHPPTFIHATLVH